MLVGAAARLQYSCRDAGTRSLELMLVLLLHVINYLYLKTGGSS
jgi:hypothetical protein